MTRPSPGADRKTWYELCVTSLGIRTLEVLGETEHQVYLPNGLRQRKKTESWMLFKTKGEAAAKARELLLAKITRLQENIEDAKDKIQDMEEIIAAEQPPILKAIAEAEAAKVEGKTEEAPASSQCALASAGGGW